MSDTQAAELQTPQTPYERAPFMEHLKELRNRILYSAIAIVIGLVVGMFCGELVLRILLVPAPSHAELVTIRLVEGIAVYFKVGLLFGLIMTMPFLLYQLFAFVAPGLTPKERRFILIMIPAIVFMFLCGVAFAYFIALPPALNFLFTFDVGATPMVSLDNYVSLVVRILVVLGLVFETPLIIMGMASLGVVSPQWLAKRRKWWILLAFIIAAISTPTPDPVTQTIVAVPLILLLELGILLSRLVYKKKRGNPTQSATA
ncbi:MAG: twin-arginine translocase subunit TatC [Dehalococcoidia bacterium]|nr:twin-arginine translocase subunit TatC [Dehalococcoidia bacterium]